MKINYLFTIVTALFLASCDFVLLKDTDKPSLEPNEKNTAPPSLVDEKGCATTAGYKWSAIKNKCIRPVEEGFRMNKTVETTNFEATKSAFVLFDDEKTTAELFFPEQTSAVTMRKKNDFFEFKNYKLFLKPSLKVTLNDTLIYIAAKTLDKPVSGKSTAD